MFLARTRGCVPWAASMAAWGRCSRSAQAEQATAASNHFHLHPLAWLHLLPSFCPSHPRASSPAQVVEIHKGTATIKAVILTPVGVSGRLGSGWLCGPRGPAGDLCRLLRLALFWARPTHAPAAGLGTRLSSTAPRAPGSEHPTGAENGPLAPPPSADGYPSVNASPSFPVPPEREPTPALALGFTGGVFQSGWRPHLPGKEAGDGVTQHFLCSLCSFFFHSFTHCVLVPNHVTGSGRRCVCSMQGATSITPTRGPTPDSDPWGQAAQTWSLLGDLALSVDTRVLPWCDFDLQCLQTFWDVTARPPLLVSYAQGQDAPRHPARPRTE